MRIPKWAWSVLFAGLFSLTAHAETSGPANEDQKEIVREQLTFLRANSDAYVELEKFDLTTKLPMKQPNPIKLDPYMPFNKFWDGVDETALYGDINLVARLINALGYAKQVRKIRKLIDEKSSNGEPWLDLSGQPEMLAELNRDFNPPLKKWTHLRDLAARLDEKTKVKVGDRELEVPRSVLALGSRLEGGWSLIFQSLVENAKPPGTEIRDEDKTPRGHGEGDRRRPTDDPNDPSSPFRNRNRPPAGSPEERLAFLQKYFPVSEEVAKDVHEDLTKPAPAGSGDAGETAAELAGSLRKGMREALVEFFRRDENKSLLNQPDPGGKFYRRILWGVKGWSTEDWESDPTLKNAKDDGDFLPRFRAARIDKKAANQAFADQTKKLQAEPAKRADVQRALADQRFSTESLDQFSGFYANTEAYAGIDPAQFGPGGSAISSDPAVAAAALELTLVPQSGLLVKPFAGPDGKKHTLAVGSQSQNWSDRRTNLVRAVQALALGEAGQYPPLRKTKSVPGGLTDSKWWKVSAVDQPIKLVDTEKPRDP